MVVASIINTPQTWIGNTNLRTMQAAVAMAVVILFVLDCIPVTSEF